MSMAFLITASATDRWKYSFSAYLHVGFIYEELICLWPLRLLGWVSFVSSTLLWLTCRCGCAHSQGTKGASHIVVHCLNIEDAGLYVLSVPNISTFLDVYCMMVAQCYFLCSGLVLVLTFLGSRVKLSMTPSCGSRICINHTVKNLRFPRSAFGYLHGSQHVCDVCDVGTC
jgi:hypothetical protein